MVPVDAFKGADILAISHLTIDLQISAKIILKASNSS
jgi:hypothetical protein